MLQILIYYQNDFSFISVDSMTYFSSQILVFFSFSIIVCRIITLQIVLRKKSQQRDIAVEMQVLNQKWSLLRLGHE